MMRPIPDYEAGRTIPIMCGRCGGRGQIEAYHWNQGGICFSCGGHGILGYRSAEEREAELDELRRRAEAAEKKAARLRARVAKALAADPELAEAFKVARGRAVASIQDKFNAKAKISEAQRALVIKIATETAERQATEAARKSAMTDLEAGRYTIEGEIVSVKVKDDAYGRTTIKILVELANGNRVFGTAPQSIMWEQCTDESGPFARPVDIAGRRVKMTATVEPRERGFGFYKRPTKATLTA